MLGKRGGRKAKINKLGYDKFLNLKLLTTKSFERNL
jgi:hypothetical protein